MDRLAELDHAIAALEAQRGVLGDAVVDTALQPLLERRAEELARSAGEQRKLVTVLFSDLMGFTSMSEAMDAEDVRAALDVYFARWREAIEARGGVVEKYIGDAVMAVFGLHRAEEDDAERAIRAALAMRDELDGVNAVLGPEYGIELAMRVGIDTGDVVVSTLDDRRGQDFVVVGDIVNRASRIQSAAPRNGVLISHDTYRHVRGVFRLERVEPLRLKGVRDPVGAFLVVGARTRTFRVGSRGVEGLETRTVGRDLELRRLQDLFWEALEDRRWRLVTAVGEAGVGKSRLLYDFENWVDVLPEAARYFTGRAVPATRNHPNGLLRDVLAFRFEIQDSDPPDTVWSKLERGLAEVFGTDVAGRAQSRLVARWLGFEIGDTVAGDEERDAEGVRDRAAAHLAEYFRSLAEQTPVVMLLEDLHWAEDTSLDWLDRLAPAVADRPMLVVATARPSLFEHRPHWGEGLEYHTRLHLEPLTRRESRHLLAEILQRAEHVPDELEELVVTAAEGNPFYIEELVKWLVEEGVIDTGGPAWVVHEDRLREVRVPPTLKGVLQARLDALATEERVLLQRAAVIGRVFWDDAVEHLAEARPAVAVEGSPQDVLDRLRRREVIYQRERSSFERTSEFVFKHALLRDVTYDSVLRAQRRAYHAAAARWLEDVTERRRRADEYAAAIAEHYEQAGEDGLAARWYVRAGSQAARRYANGEAARLLDRAVELAPEDDPALRFDALHAREGVLDRIGERAAQQRDVDEMIALAPRLDPGRQARLLVARSKLAFFHSAYDQQSELAGQAVELARRSGSLELEGLAHLWWGKGLTWQGDHEQARRRLEDALERTRAAGDALRTGETLRYLAIVAGNVSEFRKALDLLEQARDVHRGVEDLHGEMQTVAQMATAFYNMGDFASARRCLEQALPVFRLMGYRYADALATSNLAIIAFGQGHFGEAQRLLEESVRLSEDLADREGLATSLEMLGDLARSIGDLDLARERLGRALELAPPTEFPYLASDGLLLLSLVTLDGDDPAGALDLADQALDAARRAVSPMAEARAEIGRGYALLAAGSAAEAGAAFARAADVLEEIGLAKTRYEALAGQAAAALAAGAAQEAVGLVEPVLDHLGPDDLEGTVRPGEVVRTCWRALSAAADPRADGVRKAAGAFLDEMAARIDDDGLREAYLHRVPVNRALAGLAAGDDG
ncbi:MAG TPA: adenylate/guanylate cyclase domain-containing protein [Acidimicrobiales bacterium]